ncbi:NUDIX domain-containing protein [Streptacidiphilus sp. MAP5-3]|uniref:NUDIX domain-containing protein n=1 Tax=unclassified Streptacidiphilus TaxID=2643834 RepID=UPI0035111C7D
MANGWMPPEEYVRTLPKQTGYACLYFTDEHGNPLQLRSVHAEHAEMWQWFGGNLDAGETPWAAAVRECREETGLDFRGEPRLLLTHFVTPRATWPCPHVGFVFDGGTLTARELAAITLDPAEHGEWAVRSPEAWRDDMDDSTYRRLAAAVEARRTGVAGYLETLNRSGD